MGFLIDMINVGQGDAFLLTIDSPSGPANVLIDAGTESGGSDVVNYVNTYAPEGLDFVFVTHLDNDHIGGMPTVLSRVKLKSPSGLAMNVPPGLEHWRSIEGSLRRPVFSKSARSKRILDALHSCQQVQAIARMRDMRICNATAGSYWPASGIWGGVTLRTLNPTPARLRAAWEDAGFYGAITNSDRDSIMNAIMESYYASSAPDTSAENDASIVLELEYFGKPYGLFASDAGAGVLREVTAGKKYSFLKVPHHGSKTGLDTPLVKQISPTWAAIPVGDNPHGHPCSEILDMLSSVGCVTYCSTRTPHCRRECAANSRNISFPHDRSLRADFSKIDVTKCRNNSRSWGTTG